MGRKRSTKITFTDYMMINGELVEIDPAKTDLPERCKIALAEMMTGKKYQLVDNLTSKG